MSSSQDVFIHKARRLSNEIETKEMSSLQVPSRSFHSKLKEKNGEKAWIAIRIAWLSLPQSVEIQGMGGCQEFQEDREACRATKGSNLLELLALYEFGHLLALVQKVMAPQANSGQNINGEIRPLIKDASK